LIEITREYRERNGESRERYPGRKKDIQKEICWTVSNYQSGCERRRISNSSSSRRRCRSDSGTSIVVFAVVEVEEEEEECKN